MSRAACSLELRGIDGANPLGFLAALGTLVAARAAGETDARLLWRRTHTWVPSLDALSAGDPACLSDKIVEALRGRKIAPDAEARRKAAERALDKANTSIRKKRDDINARGLRRDEKRAALEAELAPLEQERDRERKEWLAALEKAMPRAELALGKTLDCTAGEYREYAIGFLEDAAHATREPLDFLAAFGTDACRTDRKADDIEPTPFCFIKGSGHQYFLATVKELIGKADSGRVREALFEPWAYRDETLSMRWDPIEDRRYALLDRDPTASDNKSQTVWMANLLAYRGLTLFPCAPTRQGLGTTGWSPHGGEVFTWPIWEFAASPDTIRSLLQLQELIGQHPDRTVLRARGVAGVFRASRIRVPPAGSNYKLNFTRSRRVG